MRYVMQMIDRATGDIKGYEYQTVEELSEVMGVSLSVAELLHTDRDYRRKVSAMKDVISTRKKPTRKPNTNKPVVCVQTGKVYYSIKEVIDELGICSTVYKGIREGKPIRGKDYVRIDNLDEFVMKKYAELQMEQNKLLNSIHFKEKERWEQDEFFMSVSNYINEVEANG